MYIYSALTETEIVRIRGNYAMQMNRFQRGERI